MNTKTLIQILIVMMLLPIYSLSFAYIGNVHQYIIEQAYELLETETGIGYEEYINDFSDSDMQYIIYGSIYEDITDWIYHYHLDGYDPPFNQTLTNDLILIFGESGRLQTVTHFWDADAGIYDKSFLSGEMASIYWSMYVDNSFVKAKRYFQGYEGGNPYWIPIKLPSSVEYFVTNYPSSNGYVVPEPYGLNELYTNGSTKLYNWDHLLFINGYANYGQDCYFNSEWRRNTAFAILGRILHLLGDMSVPAHAHNDDHGPIKYTITGDWHTHTCDKYEGWLTHGEGGFMAFTENWYWNYINILAQKGGYIDISQENDPLYFAMYTVNQIADFFASDDVDGDNILTQGSNAILDAMYAELEFEFPPDHPVRNAHEMTDIESSQIRDVVFPFVIRMTAGFLKWFAEVNNLTQYNLQLADTLKGYFYSYTNPVPDPDETNKEISLYYITHNPFDPEVRVTIEKENGETIWDNVEVALHLGVPKAGYLTSWNFYKRLILDDQNYTGPITIQVSEDGIVTKESTVNYNPSNKPPLPILFPWPDEEKGIYPTHYGNYTSGLYYNHSYNLNINAPYSGDIDTWYNIKIEWDEEDGEHIFPLNYTSYVQFNDNGTVDLDIPQKSDIIDPGVTAGNVRLKINDVEGWDNHPIVFNTEAFSGLIKTVSYPGIIIYCIGDAPPPGCPTLYYGNERENNIIPLGENQEQDCFDYTLLKNTVKNSEVIEMKVIENQDNSNYFDLVQLVAVGHSKDTEVGINNKTGEIFLYNPKSQIRFGTGKDSSFVLQAEDSLLINLSDFNIPPVEYVYLKVTCSLLSNKVTANPNKEHFSIGEQASKDTTENVIDIVGLHETEFTSYSEINEDDIDLSNGILLIKPSRDIEISEISVVLDNSGKEDFEVSNCNILKAISVQDNKNVLNYIHCDDNVYYEFGMDDGINLLFENPILNNETADYVFISKGRYIHNQQDEIEDITYKLSNYPNPFNPDEIGTTISFSNTKPSKIEIYNIKGQLVKNFNLESEQSMVIWDGKDYNGVQVANGIYFYKLSCMNKSIVRKMILLR